MICIWILYTGLGSVEVLQVTGSLVLRILLWCLVIVYFLSCGKSLTVSKSWPGLLCQPVHSAGYQQSSYWWLCTLPVARWHPVTLGVAGPELTLVGSVFVASCRYRGTRRVIRELESLGVVKLDTSVVPDVLGLRALYDDAEPIRVLPSRAQNSVRVLVPDARAMPRGFHDVTLLDMTKMTGRAVSAAGSCDLRRQWPNLC